MYVDRLDSQADEVHIYNPCLTRLLDVEHQSQHPEIWKQQKVSNDKKTESLLLDDEENLRLAAIGSQSATDYIVGGSDNNKGNMIDESMIWKMKEKHKQSAHVQFTGKNFSKRYYRKTEPSGIPYEPPKNDFIVGHDKPVEKVKIIKVRINENKKTGFSNNPDSMFNFYFLFFYFVFGFFF